MQMYLKLDGIKGEVTTSAYKEWIAVHSFSWGEASPVDASTGAGTGRTVVSPMKLLLKSGISTPAIAQSVFAGKILDKASLAIKVTKARGRATNENKFHVDMYKAQIESLTFGGSETDGVPSDQITIAFHKIELTDGNVTTSIDLQKGQIG